jgi:hypothetical protein
VLLPCCGRYVELISDHRGDSCSTTDERLEANMTAVESRMRTRAEANITVQNSEAKPFDQTTSPLLTEIHIRERFTGDIDGESTVRALQVQRHDHDANLVSMQRFRGTLGGRQGTFVRQGQETVENGRIKATWFVVPGSGTGDLTGLRGEGGFQGEFGKGFSRNPGLLVRMT